MNTATDTFNRPEDTIAYLEARVEALTKALEESKREYTELLRRYQLTVRLMNANVKSDDHLAGLDVGG